MKSRMQRWFLITVVMLLAGCGPARPSIFPPQAGIDLLQLADQGPWTLTLRLRNDSYAPMHFGHFEARLRVDQLPPLPVRADLNLDLPALSADAVHVALPASTALRAALLRSRHSTFGLPYRLSGQVAAARDGGELHRFAFSHDDRLYPVPGDPQRFR